MGKRQHLGDQPQHQWPHWLPNMTDTGASGCDFVYTGTDRGYSVDTFTGEMAHMYDSTLGNHAYFSTLGVGNQPGYGLSSIGLFSNAQYGAYWTATEYAPRISYAWRFIFDDGTQGNHYKTNNFYAWALHTGDVGVLAVPVLAAAWLLGSGLLGLVDIAKRKRVA